MHMYMYHSRAVVPSYTSPATLALWAKYMITNTKPGISITTIIRSRAFTILVTRV